jgi:hypothetical protein
MLRLTGMLIGSALAVATLILALGVPRLSPPVAGSAEPDIVPAPQPVSEPAPIREPEPVPEPAPVEQPKPEPDPEIAARVDQVFAPEETREIVTATEPEPTSEDGWYAFWSPFRSELAANGFVARLQDATGLDYRVVKVKTGVYEVAFAYTDEADIEAKLERIANATGLDMTGG